MNEQETRVEITQEKLKAAAKAGRAVLNLESTLIPGHLRVDIMTLDAVLAAIESGDLVVGTPSQQVES